MGLRSLGLIVGFISAGLGVGGGAMIVPTLVSFFHFDFRRAASTSLAAIIPISFVGAAGHLLFSKYDLQIFYFLFFIPFCILGAVLAGDLIGRFKPPYLKLAFAVFILISGLKMLNVFDFSFFLFDALKDASAGYHLIWMAIFGVISGVISTLLGVGCGLIIVPFFVVFVGLGVHEAIALSLVTMFFLTMTATLVHKKHRALDEKAVMKMFFPALIGAVAGAIVSNHLPAAMLKQIFAVFLLSMALNFLIGERIIASIRSRREVQGELQNM